MNVKKITVNVINITLNVILYANVKIVKMLMNLQKSLIKKVILFILYKKEKKLKNLQIDNESMLSYSLFHIALTYCLKLLSAHCCVQSCNHSLSSELIIYHKLIS